MKKIALLLVAVVMAVSVYSRQYTISGQISDANSGETLIGATIIDLLSKKGVVTNPYGFYSLTLPEGEINLSISYVGYATQNLDFILSKDTTLNIKLDSSIELSETVVYGRRTEVGVRGTQMSAIEVPIEQVKSIPSLLGEVDLIKALQLLPGVQGGTEGSAGMYVRGGGPDQNLLLLDGVPIYNVNHLFGFFSVFNADAIKNVTLYKGDFPARFGSRLSSVLDIRMNDGNMREYHGSVSVGLISSKLNFEGPIIKDKTSFNISARRTYVDALVRPLLKMTPSSERIDAGYYFYDFNGKINHKLSDKDRLYLSFYSGDDVIYMNVEEKGTSYGYHNDVEYETESLSKMKMNWDWGNLVTALRWNRIVNHKLFLNTTASYTRYRFILGMNEQYSEQPSFNSDYNYKLGYNSGIEDYSARIDFDYIPNNNHDIKFGVNYTYHSFKPGVISLKEKTSWDIPQSTASGDKPIYTSEMSLYLEDNITFTDYLKMNIGLHNSTFSVQQKIYNSLEPRISSRILLSDVWSVKAAYARMSQHIHLLTNSNVSMPTDLWVPVTKRIEPMTANQYSLGLFYNFMNEIDFSLEGYYKTMSNIIEYKDGASFWGSSTGWEDKVAMGDGWSYGVEFLAQRSFGKTTGWVGYTWSKSDRLFDRPGEELNFGKSFPAKYDRRHDISLVASHKFSEKIDISGTWVFSSGNSGTLALQTYEGIEADQYGSDNHRLEYISSRNNYRYPNYHRFDIGVNFHKQKKYGKRTWNLSVYNAYNQLNPFVIYINEDGYWNGEDWVDVLKLKQVSLFPLIPSISYTYKF